MSIYDAQPMLLSDVHFHAGKLHRTGLLLCELCVPEFRQAPMFHLNRKPRSISRKPIRNHSKSLL